MSSSSLSLQQQQQAPPKETNHLTPLDHVIAKCNKFDHDNDSSYQTFIWHQQLVDEGSI